MADKYSTIQQHQPLRVPESFDRQGKALIVQLDEIFDDIYRRFGRLRIEDMGKVFRKRIEDDEGNIAELTIDVGAITIEVGNKYDKISGIAIESAGIGLTGGKYIKINSGCELDIESGGDVNIKSGADLNIKSGGTLAIDSGNFSIDSSGAVTLKGAAEILSGKALKIKSGGDLNVESGGDINVQSGGHLTVASGGDLTVNSGGNMVVSSGGSLNIKSGNSTGILLDSSGIDMQTAGKVRIHAKDATSSSIIFGTNEASATFMVGLTGDVKATSVTTTSLSVAGRLLPGIVVSETQPSGSNIIWVKPSSSTDKQWSKTPENYNLNTQGGTLGYYRDFTVDYSADDYLSGNLFYGIKVRLYYFANTWQNVSLKARLKNGNNWIDLGAQTDYCGQGSTVAVDNMISSATTNIMNVSGGSFTVRIETNLPSGQCRLVIEDFILKAKTTSGGGFAACSVFYKG
jgi:hypothetical protein